MNTPATMTRLSAWSLGITLAATESATALATAFWAGPNICAAWVMPLMVTLVINTVAGLQIRFGVSTASRLVCPALWLESAVANAVPTGPSLEPINKSMCAISLPSPTSASPMYMDMAGSPRRLQAIRSSLSRAQPCSGWREYRKKAGRNPCCLPATLLALAFRCGGAHTEGHQPRNVSDSLSRGGLSHVPQPILPSPSAAGAGSFGGAYRAGLPGPGQLPRRLLALYHGRGRLQRRRPPRRRGHPRPRGSGG